MGKSYRPYLPEQDLLLPPSLRDWLPESHLVYFVSDVVDQLDLSAIESVYEKEWRGQPPYHPRLMVKLLVYGYCRGVRSSRKIAQRLVEDVPFRVLAAGNQPDFRTISDFRKIHLEALEQLFQQVLRLALEAGAMKLGAGGAGRHEDESQRFQAQGHELGAHEASREADCRRGQTDAGRSGEGRCRRGRPLRARQVRPGVLELTGQSFVLLLRRG